MTGLFDDLRDLYQEVILDHGRKPRNFGALEGANREAHGHNPLCGDKLDVRLLVKDGIVEDVKFEGAGCAISVASASLMTTQAKGKTAAEVQALYKNFHEIVTTGKEQEEISDLAAFAGVHAFPARIKCATAKPTRTEPPASESQGRRSPPSVWTLASRP